MLQKVIKLLSNAQNCKLQYFRDNELMYMQTLTLIQ